MATLPDEIKIFIVKGLARYDTPTRVAHAVTDNFGIEITRQQVHRFDPDCAQPPARRWIELHAATRQAYLRQVAEIGTAQKAVRLAMLDRMVQTAMQSNIQLAAKLLVQIAKECGGVYERRNAMPAAIVAPAPEPPAAAVDSTEPPMAAEAPPVLESPLPLAACPAAAAAADEAAETDAEHTGTPQRAEIRPPASGIVEQARLRRLLAIDDQLAAYTGLPLSSPEVQPVASIRKSPEALAVAT